jgi:hypothetical protein
MNKERIRMPWEKELLKPKSKRRPKKATYVVIRDNHASIPVDRHSLAQRMAYGYSLMALDGDERYE